ncbi:unnamed protein product [Ascophyllum nodosum]
MDVPLSKTVLCGCLFASISTRTFAFAPIARHVASLRSQTRERGYGPSIPSSSRRRACRMSVARSSNNHNNNDHSGSSSSSSIDRNTDGITDSPDGLGNISITGGGGTGGVGSGQSIGQRAAEPVAFLQTARPSMALGNALRGAAGGVAGEEVVTSPGAMLATVNRTERGQKLRALNWVKQVRNDLTSAEFALNLNAFRIDPGWSADERAAAAGVVDGVANGGRGGGGDTMSKIDYDRIAERLEAILRTLKAGRPLSLLETISQEELLELNERLEANLAKIKKITQAEGGRSPGAASDAPPPSKGGNDGIAAGGGEQEDVGSWSASGGILDDVKGGINVKVPEFDLFVRDDGTVDWDGAIQSGREVARFGQELWDRINGQNPNEEGGLVGSGVHGTEKPPKEVPEDSPVMVALNAVGAELEDRLDQFQKELDALRADARAQEATWQGLDRRHAQRRIREKEREVNSAKRQLQLHRIDVDMERICYTIEQEIRESTSSSPSEYRRLVAEFGLLDAQLANLTKLAAAGLTDDQANGGVDGLERLVIDEDELELVSREVLDLKNRLGMDLENPALSIDPEKVSRYVRETYEKVKHGIDFYWTGTKILGSDIGYALTLISKAAQGSILKPREVRTLRRTAKDCVTFIPFVVILIFPLTPVGHVLVFSFIQRFFPDFFPSTYTDRRQNLLKMYTEVDKKVDWDGSDLSGGDDEGDDMLEKLRRNFMATLNQVGDEGDKGKIR